MDVKKLVSQMTLEEKAGLCSGKTMWHTKSVERLGIPSIMVSDGPHGLRKQDLTKTEHPDHDDSIIAVCFPTAAGLASSFDRDLIYRMGETLGEECQAEDVAIILGPGANIKRSPLCGRNFEYFSEDPFLSGEMAGAYIRGVQSKNIGTSLKHYAMNNQETRRLAVDVRADERTIREIYLANFERAVTRGKPWTVMCSYNKINGVYSSENKFTLTDVLRDEWGFDGFTMTDWGAVNDHIAGIKAGLELEMPASGEYTDKLVVEAVKSGKLDEKILDRAVERILNIVFRYLENRDRNAVFDREKHHQIARQIAGETFVLLKNDRNILPLSPQKKIAFIGAYAKKPRFQGSGSSHINVSKLLGALEAAEEITKVTYAQGYDDETDETNPALLQEAIEVAKKSDVAILFVGLPGTFESEGYDRSHMRMPKCQNELIEEIAKVNPNTVVVLHNGSPVEMPWADRIPAVLECYLGGQAVGGAEVDVLFGKVNPSGKLAESFPYQLEDNPSYLNFPGEGDVVEYREGVYVGYRYYDKKKMAVRFPFGHGLSYTTFEYSDLKLSKKYLKQGESLDVSVNITNNGKVKGKEAVQLYVQSTHTGVPRPIKELKEFAKIELAPGETKTIHFTLPPRAFAYYEVKIKNWYVEG
ncbi:MAG TPA: glycoside hydrolase family 3 C-terminal domain-containing protein, partial [Flexilinea sp.]|nr:glycoside hydrolase family 3 C-terminal domain-containing protein [Flexilinea sp.]